MVIVLPSCTVVVFGTIRVTASIAKLARTTYRLLCAVATISLAPAGWLAGIVTLVEKYPLPSALAVASDVLPRVRATSSCAAKFWPVTLRDAPACTLL
jgi:hypothetical protein